MHSHQEQQTPDQLFFFNMYVKSRRYNDEFRVYNQALLEEFATNALSSLFNTFVTLAEEANSKSIERLSTYGHLFLERYIEPTLQQTDDELNLLTGLNVQYEYRDTCHSEEWDLQTFKTIKTSITKVSVGIKADSSVNDATSHSPDHSLTFDELHQLIKEMWTNHSELLLLAERLSARSACLENWRRKRENNP